jgi:hypothetical protein
VLLLTLTASWVVDRNSFILKIKSESSNQAVVDNNILKRVHAFIPDYLPPRELTSDEKDLELLVTTGQWQFSTIIKILQCWKASEAARSSSQYTQVIELCRENCVPTQDPLFITDSVFLSFHAESECKFKAFVADCFGLSPEPKLE